MILIQTRLLIYIQIQQHMEQLIHRSSAISELSYLRILQLVHTQISSLVDDLKVYELPSTALRTFDSPELRRANAATAGSSTSTFSNMLETAMDELFIPYTEGQRYLEKESKSLGTLYTSLLGPFARFHVR